MYIYLDEKGYVYGYGSEYEENSFEVPFVPNEVDAFLGCYKYEDGKYILDENRKAYILELKDAEKELVSLEEWFKWYDTQNIQYQRSQRLKKKYDIDISYLDGEAEKNAEKIKNLRNKLGGKYVDL